MMKDSKTLIYDGSFNGFLTAIFAAFEKNNVVDIQRNSQEQNELFSETETIFTNVEQAKRVWNGIRSKSHNAITNVYFAFLSEAEGIESMLFSYIQKLMVSKTGILDYTDDVLRIGQLARSVRREKQRMEASVCFQLTKDDIHFATVASDFDILPLISKHFRNRYANQQWLIYDIKRKYGIFYTLSHVELVSLNLEEVFCAGKHDSQTFWNNDIKTIPIKSQINRKLLTQRTAKRHWRYLSEKKETA
ncbi:MAG: TIGR03915 family putative DNA repair protein [Flavobacteriaceae bacterium]